MLIKFSEIENLTMLSQFLYIKEDNLLTLLKEGAVSSCCEKMAIPKKNRALGYRVVYKVNSHLLKNVHKVLCGHLNAVYDAPAFVHGFVLGGCTRRNAAQHLNKKKILGLDIDRFFDSISENAIKEVFCGLGCRMNIAANLSKLTTINGRLPQGFNTSPVLANIMFGHLDAQLNSICNDYGCIYTRYADDITISTDDQLPPVARINDVLFTGGFRLNSSKERVMFRGKKQYVTGLTVFDPEYPRVPKRFKRRIRLQLYYLVKFGAKSYVMRELGLSEEDVRNDYEKLQLVSGRKVQLQYQIKGWIDYVNSIEPLLSEKYYESYNAIAW
ncbi:MAG: Reverse transcriptase (RNA-dependent DNA polymerase) [Syntrophorhabdaceae bacterium PtaU1.Bin034]|jgi:retron-type reverse transcriptase|nr:MAG: Reverse transcriptase (RNA-dependent DNA polymerase) [Syntrophorhabdaceae bacterium PtaU1.Bin034]